MIAINGLKVMPKSCGECLLVDRYNCCKITRRGCKYDIEKNQRETHCPLIEVTDNETE